MLLFSEGSVEIGVINRESSIIAYPTIMHHIKALSHCKASIPDIVKNLHAKFLVLKELLRDWHL